jgi:hypothetical protein
MKTKLRGGKRNKEEKLEEIQSRIYQICQKRGE